MLDVVPTAPSLLAVDPLTRMLNADALDVRAAELAHQSLVARDPIGLIAGALDGAHGDAVLREAASRVRSTLRAYDLVYHLGEGRIVVLVPGARLDETGDLAERLRAAIAAHPCAGAPVTMRFGVAATGRGEVFALDLLLARARAALAQTGADDVRGAESALRPASALRAV